MVANKAKGQRNPVAKPEPLALAQTARVAQSEEGPAANGKVAGSIPATGTKFHSQRKLLAGLNLGQAQGRIVEIHFGPFARRKQGPK